MALAASYIDPYVAEIPDDLLPDLDALNPEELDYWLRNQLFVDSIHAFMRVGWLCLLNANRQGGDRVAWIDASEIVWALDTTLQLAHNATHDAIRLGLLDPATEFSEGVFVIGNKLERYLRPERFDWPIHVQSSSLSDTAKRLADKLFRRSVREERSYKAIGAGLIQFWPRSAAMFLDVPAGEGSDAMNELFDKGWLELVSRGHVGGSDSPPEAPIYRFTTPEEYAA